MPEKEPLSPTASATRDLARWLLVCEARSHSPDTRAAAVAPDERTLTQVCEKLRQHLSELVGVIGFRSLLSRALCLGQKKVPELAALHIDDSGSLTRIPGAEAGARPEEVSRGGEILLAELFGLLFAFIGETLTMRLVRHTWPDAPFETSDSAPGENP